MTPAGARGLSLRTAVIQLPHLSAPDIRHITATFNNIVSYSRSCVLTAQIPDSQHRRPGASYGNAIEGTRHPDLQDKQTISMATGDYHALALTADGRILASGQNGTGQLGIGEADALPGRQRGETSAVTTPTRVFFGRGDAEDWQAEQRRETQSERDAGGDFDVTTAPRRRFAFAVSAGGWHSGALVVDMDSRGGMTRGRAEQNDPVGTNSPDGEVVRAGANLGTRNAAIPPRDAHDLPFQRPTGAGEHLPSAQQGPRASYMPFPFIRLGHAAGLASQNAAAGAGPSDRPGRMMGDATARRLGARRPMSSEPQGGDPSPDEMAGRE